MSTKNLIVKGENKIGKIIFPKSGGLKLEYQFSKSYGDQGEHSCTNKPQYTMDINKKFLDARRGLDKHVAWSNYMFSTGIMGKELKDLPTKEQTAFKAVLDKIEITEINFGGKGDGEWVLLKATGEGIDGGTFSLETTKIHLLMDKYPYVNDFNDCIDKVLECTQNYIKCFDEDKQLHLFSEVVEIEKVA